MIARLKNGTNNNPSTSSLMVINGDMTVWSPGPTRYGGNLPDQHIGRIMKEQHPDSLPSKRHILKTFASYSTATYFKSRFLSMRTALVISLAAPLGAQNSLSLPDAVRPSQRAVPAAEKLKAAERAVRSAEADLKRSEAVRSIRTPLTAPTGRVARVRTAA